MKHDGNCLHGAGPGSPGDCTLPRKEGSVLCEDHHAAVIAGHEKAPPLRMNRDYVSQARRGLVDWPSLSPEDQEKLKAIDQAELDRKREAMESPSDLNDFAYRGKD